MIVIIQRTIVIFEDVGYLGKSSSAHIIPDICIHERNLFNHRTIRSAVKERKLISLDITINIYSNKGEPTF